MSDENRSDEPRAESFAKLVDEMLEGEAIPPALDAEDRALLETATMIVASTQELRLSGDRSRAIVDEALEQAITGSRRLSTVPEADGQAIPEPVERDNTDVVRLSSRRADRAIRVLPWVVATVAAAAALLLFISRPETTGPGPISALAKKQAPAHQSSRSADALIGQIRPDRSEFASERLDIIVADRMAGFREIVLTSPIQKGVAKQKGINR